MEQVATWRGRAFERAHVGWVNTSRESEESSAKSKERKITTQLRQESLEGEAEMGGRALKVDGRYGDGSIERRS
jgi:hypothetical protein